MIRKDDYIVGEVVSLQAHIPICLLSVVVTVGEGGVFISTGTFFFFFLRVGDKSHESLRKARLDKEGFFPVTLRWPMKQSEQRIHSEGA